MSLANFPPFFNTLISSMQSECIVSSLCKINRLFLYFAKRNRLLFICAMWTDCFFTTESEDVPFLQCQFNRLFLCCRKWRDWFLHCRKWRHSFSYSANLTDCFFTTESEDIPFLQCQFNRLFLYCRKWRDWFLHCRKWRDWFLHCRKWRHSFSTVPM